MTLELILLIISVASSIVWRYVFFLGPTEAARRIFIVSSLRSRSFAELSTSHDAIVESGGHTFPAH